MNWTAGPPSSLVSLFVGLNMKVLSNGSHSPKYISLATGQHILDMNCQGSIKYFAVCETWCLATRSVDDVGVSSIFCTDGDM